ncbi:MAG: hypothetical protein K0R94_706 [Burkholderiales bacterium]|jgi:prepilin-type N-terminal cleavage/methylation domain-containing protein|nr:hypothetical protein [Burkholderiales bacterium]
MIFQLQRQSIAKFQGGFSAIELLMALTIMAAITLIAITFGNSLVRRVPAETVANQAYNYSRAVKRYITTHQNLLRQLLQNNGVGNIATVSTKILRDEGFIKNNLYDQNKLGQYPCMVIWFAESQLQSIVYYRDNNDSKKMDNNQWMYGLNNIGAMLGLYTNGTVIGSAKNWTMDNNLVNQKFVKQGNVDISLHGDFYSCSGSQIANPSYVVNVTSMLTLNNILPKDDTIHQYSDVLHDAQDTMSNNRMNADLNMDYIDSNTRKRSNIIFQMESACQMDPNKLDTMQDYSPDNPRGCRNRQLAIQFMQDPINQSSQKSTIVTGFQRGGDQDTWTQHGHAVDNRPFVGELAAASFQPMIAVAVGATCNEKEIGTMARQQRSNDPNDISDIYISQLICMKSPLCGSETMGLCSMPVQNIALQIKPNIESYSCPAGTFIDTSKLSINHIDITGKGTCHAHDCAWQPYDCSATDPYQGPFEYSDKLNTAFMTQAPLYRTLKIPSTSWVQTCNGKWCHFGCGVGPGQIGNTQDTISSIQCTNDPGKAAVMVVPPN